MCQIPPFSSIHTGWPLHLKLAIGASDADYSVVSDDLRSHHGHGLALRRVDFARHDTATGFVLGELQLTKAATRAGAEVPNVIGNLHQRDRHRVERTVGLNQRIVRGECLELSVRLCEMRSTY